MSFPDELPNDSAIWNPELVPPFSSTIDASTHATPLNDVWSTESLEIVSGHFGTFLKSPLDTTNDAVRVETIDNGFVQPSNVWYELPTTRVLPTSYTFPFNAPNGVVFSNPGESDNLNSVNPVRESTMMNAVDFALAQQEAERELFGKTFEDDNIALDPLRANQNEQSATQDSSVWSLSNNYPAQSLGMEKGAMHDPHLQSTLPISASTISRNDPAVSIFNTEMWSANSVVSLDDTQIELRSELIRLPRRSGMLQTTKRVRFEAQVTDTETKEGFINIRPAETTSRGISQATVERRKR